MPGEAFPWSPKEIGAEPEGVLTSKNSSSLATPNPLYQFLPACSAGIPATSGETPEN